MRPTAIDHHLAIMVAMTVALVLPAPTGSLDAFPCALPALLDTAPNIGALSLLSAHHVDRADENFTGVRLDELDVDSRDALNEAPANLDDVKTDVDDLESLVVVVRLGANGQAVAQHLVLRLAVPLDDLGRQISMPWISAGVQLVAVQKETRSILDSKVHGQAGILALTIGTGDIEGLR